MLAFLWINIMFSVTISSKCFRCGELDSDSFITLLNKQLLFYGIYDVMFYGVKINKELFVIVFTFVNVKHLSSLKNVIRKLNQFYG